MEIREHYDKITCEQMTSYVKCNICNTEYSLIAPIINGGNIDKFVINYCPTCGCYEVDVYDLINQRNRRINER